MKAGYLFVPVMLLSIILAVVLIAQDKKPPLKKSAAKKISKTESPEILSADKEIRLLMEKFSSKSKIDILRDIKNRSAEIERMELKLKAERDILDKTVVKVKQIIADNNTQDDKRIEKFDKMLAELKGKIDQYKEQEKVDDEEKFKKVVQTFKEVKAKKAALIIPNMDIDLVVKVMLELPSRGTAAIMQSLDPKLAANISHRMAEERKKMQMKKDGEDIISKNNKEEPKP